MVHNIEKGAERHELIKGMGVSVHNLSLIGTIH